MTWKDYIAPACFALLLVGVGYVIGMLDMAVKILEDR